MRKKKNLDGSYIQAADYIQSVFFPSPRWKLFLCLHACLDFRDFSLHSKGSSYPDIMICESRKMWFLNSNEIYFGIINKQKQKSRLNCTSPKVCHKDLPCTPNRTWALRTKPTPSVTPVCCVVVLYYSSTQEIISRSNQDKAYSSILWKWEQFQSSQN